MSMASGTFIRLEERGVLRLSGDDRVPFLQGLVSNDVSSVAPGRVVYACLLTPQGKFLHDFLLVAADGAILIDCEGPRRADLLDRLRKFKLRSKIELADVSDQYAVFATTGAVPSESLAYPDPRASEVGWRALLPRETADASLVALGFSPESPEDYEKRRIRAAIPDGSRDMEPGKATLLESNIDLLNGISWDKGCYMGQELTARIRYRGLVKKRLVPIRISGASPAIGEPLIESGREVGEMRSSAGDVGLALLRLDRVREGGVIKTASATFEPVPPPRMAEVLAEAAEA
ncbi:MAG TPA: folate-binding protein [Alphaproteobacteria bacterium]|nr:folate-binding protein [Alphaproteobacteria bacterium]